MDTNNKSIIQQLLEIADSVVIEPSEDLEEGKKKGKKKPYDSVTYTTGDLQKNIDHFNKCLTGKANNDNSKGPLPDYVMAKGADGSSSIPSSAATSGDGATAGASAGGEGGGMGESLEINEAKRYVRRYYMRPQDIFCSNKAEILKALIDHQDENCVIYTLNNLGDNKDVHKLTEADIIYFYEDGILYDKNHVRIMDYDLYIKHEEERDNINPETTSDAKFQDVYDDRMTDQTVVEDLEEEFNLSFDSVDIHGFKLREAKEDTCVICGEPIQGYGNNAEPYKSGRCCDACNLKFVIPARIVQLEKDKE